MRAFQTGMWPRPSEAIPIAALTLSIWFLETLWIFFLVLGFGVTLNGKEAVFLTMIPLLASGFPLTPSGAGVVDITLFSCLRVVGIASPLAVSITVVNRFIDYWLHIGLGLLIWALREKLGIRAIRDVAGDRATPIGNCRCSSFKQTRVTQRLNRFCIYRYYPDTLRALPGIRNIF